MLLSESRVDRYRALCATETSIPIFSQAWWLDEVAEARKWDVVLVEKGERIQASMPYVLKRHRGFTTLTQAVLTQNLGPWLRPVKSKYAKQLSHQKEVLGKLIAELPDFDRFQQNWHHTQANWLPFFWNGFHQTTRYTYVLSELSNQNSLWDGLQENIRTDIRKAEGRFGLRVRTDLGVDAFLALNRMVFERQGIKLPYSEALVERLDSACGARGARRIFIAEDQDGRHHAGVYIVWDANSAYYLMGGGHPDLRHSGATSLCLWEAIKQMGAVVDNFDFEGSMLEPVERFFRAFGAKQLPYFAVSKTPSKVLRTLEFVRELRTSK